MTALHRSVLSLAACVVVAPAIVAATASIARADTGAEDRSPVDMLGIGHCAGGDGRLPVRPGDSRAMLDEPDRAFVTAAMLARYPMLQRDGFDTDHVILWQPAGGDWLYVTLLHGRENPGSVCYTATFNAKAFDFTGSLLRKYFFPPSERT